MEAVQILHRGCVSSVYLASKPGPAKDQKVVKAYHKSHLQERHWLNITREVANLCQLKELRVPGVVDLCGTVDDAGNIYLVFEPCLGGDLYKRLAYKGLLSEGHLCREVITPLLKVLHSLHQVGIIHRDIKPENIFFEPDGTLRLGDFGLAINAARERPTSRVGTLDYMAPEVLAQPSADMVLLRRIRSSQLPSYDCKVDIWALGVLVYEALTGVTPFSDPDPQAASLKAQFRQPTPLQAGVSAACADFVTQALTKQASKRPSALQLLGHPWVLAHMSEVEVLLYSGCFTAQRTCSGVASTVSGSSGHLMLSSPSSASIPLFLSGSRTSSAALAAADISSCCSSELGCNVVPVGQQVLPSSPCHTLSKQQHCQQLVSPKQQPMQTQPQQLPPNPFAAAARRPAILAARALSGPPDMMLTVAAADRADDAGAAIELKGEPGALQSRNAGMTLKLTQQSMPAPLRALSQEDALLPANSEPLRSPQVVNSGSRIAALAASPVRALLGAAGRHLVRSRSGAAAAAAAATDAASDKQGSTHNNVLCPLTSPIKGLLPASRRKPPQAASASLFAAAQWKPSSSSTGSNSSSGFEDVSCDSSSSGLPPAPVNARRAGKCSDCGYLMRACSLGPSTLLSSALCSVGSGSMAPDTQELLRTTSGRSSGSSQAGAAAAVADLVEQQAQRLPGAACSSTRRNTGAQQGTMQARPLLLSRYPSAPDPVPLLLALSPVRGATKVPLTSAPVAIPAVPGAASIPILQHTQLQAHQQVHPAAKAAATAAPLTVTAAERPPCGRHSMRGMWLKVQGVCRLVGRHRSCEDVEGVAQCVVAQSL